MKHVKEKQYLILEWAHNNGFSIVRSNVMGNEYLFSSRKFYDGKPLSAQEVVDLYELIHNPN